MGILSSSTSVVRYRVNGKIKEPLLDTIAHGLNKHRISEIDNNSEDKTSGWTSFKNPYLADFSGSSFIYDPYVVFSLRIDKKSIPPKTIQKQYVTEISRRLANNDRTYISRHEKKEIKDRIITSLGMRIPATPNIYDVIWFPEKSTLWFFSTLKSANEEVESLFLKSFSLSIIRLFPYTQAFYMEGFSDREKDKLNNLSPSNFAASGINDRLSDNDFGPAGGGTRESPSE